MDLSNTKASNNTDNFQMSHIDMELSFFINKWVSFGWDDVSNMLGKNAGLTQLLVHMQTE